MSRNPFEESGRRHKVDALVDAILKLDQPPSADDVASWCAKTWEQLTDLANKLRWLDDPKAPKMRPPSDASRALVIEALRSRELSRCLCFVPPAGPGVPHEAACPMSRVVSLADARARRAS